MVHPLLRVPSTGCSTPYWMLPHPPLCQRKCFSPLPQGNSRVLSPPERAWLSKDREAVNLGHVAVVTF